MTAPRPRRPVDGDGEGDSEIAAGVAALARGEVIAMSTDTVFGLLCNPGDPTAVERIFALKSRPATLELSLLAAAAADLEELVVWARTARELAATFWPGPLSLVLPVGPRPLAIPRHGGTLSVRVPDHAPLRGLLTRSGPLASTSANRHGHPAALTAAEVRRQFGAAVGTVIERGHPGGVASTIIDCSVTPPRVLREGPIDSRALAEFVQA